MHKANVERLRREQASATVDNLASIAARLEAIEGRQEAVDAKLERALKLLDGLAEQLPAGKGRGKA